MGNYKSLCADSSFFKIYDSKEWVTTSKNGVQIWKHVEKGNHCLAFTIPNYLSIEDLQRYEFRYLHGYYLVKVIHVVRMKEQSLITQNENNIVLIQWIVARLPEIQILKFEEALTVLRSIFKGFSLLYSFYGSFDISLDMVGVNEKGYVKVWLNTDFNNNQLIEKGRNNSNNKGITNKSQLIQNILKIFSLIELKVKNGYQANFKQHLSSLQSFIEAIDYIQNYLIQNKINTNSFINIQTMNLLLKKHVANENLLYNPNNLHKDINHQRRQKITPKEISIKEFNWESLNRQKSQSNTAQRIKSPNIQIKCKSPTSYFDNQQGRNSQLISFSWKAETNKPPILTKHVEQKSITPKSNYTKKNNQYLNQDQQFRRHTYMFDEKFVNTLTNQQNHKNKYAKYYQSAKIKSPPNLTFNEPKYFQKTPNSIKNYSTQLYPKKIQKDQYKIYKQPQLQHIKPKTMDLYEKYKINKPQRRNDFSDKAQIKYQTNKILTDSQKNNKNKHYKFQCPEQFDVSKSAQVPQSKTTYKHSQKLNETLVEDLNTLLQGDKCSSPVNLLQQMMFKQQTVESDVDEMEGSQQLKSKLNRIKIDGLIQERKRRQTQNFHKFLELNNDIKQQYTIQNIVTNPNAKYHQKTKNNQKNLHMKTNSLQLMKVKSESSSQIKNQGSNEVYKNCQWPKKIKDSHDTFYTNNDIYGINAKYDKYVVNKDHKKKGQIIIDQKTTKKFLKLKQGEKSDIHIKHNYMIKEYFFQ